MNSIAKPAATVTTKNAIHSRAFKAAGMERRHPTDGRCTDGTAMA
jgi:hypothetical protein